MFAVVIRLRLFPSRVYIQRVCLLEVLKCIQACHMLDVTLHCAVEMLCRSLCAVYNIANIKKTHVGVQKGAMSFNWPPVDFAHQTNRGQHITRVTANRSSTGALNLPRRFYTRPVRNAGSEHT